MTKAIEEFLCSLISSELNFIGTHPLSIPWNVLERRNLISHLEPATEVICPHGEYSKVIWLSQKEDAVPYMYCHLCGLAPLTKNDIRRWRPEFIPFLNQAAEKFEIKGNLTTLIPELLWHLGWKSKEPWFFLRWCSIDEVQLVKPIIDQAPKAMIVTGFSLTAEHASIFWPGRAISLAVYADLSMDGELVLDHEMLKERGILLDSQSKRKTCSHQRKRTTKIDILTRELKEFVKTARAHAKEHCSDEDFRPLERPTLTELSQRTGIPKSTISRCLKDEEATVLRVLWERLDDPWGVVPK